MKKKLLTLLLAAGAVSVVLTACSRPDTKSSDSANEVGGGLIVDDDPFLPEEGVSESITESDELQEAASESAGIKEIPLEEDTES